jgi:hypothetical protein
MGEEARGQRRRFRPSLAGVVAPLIEAARAATMDAPAPSLALDAFVQAHEVVMMHEARPQVAGGKNASLACLEPKDK